MDAYGHVNHANMVTLLEEARVAMVFTEATRQGIASFARGMVVAKLSVHYRAPLVPNGGAVEVEMSVRDLRASSFVLDYVLRAEPNGTPIVTADTLMVAYDVERSGPRRLSDQEREFLAEWHLGGSNN